MLQLLHEDRYQHIFHPFVTRVGNFTPRGAHTYNIYSVFIELIVRKKMDIQEYFCEKLTLYSGVRGSEISSSICHLVELMVQINLPRLVM